MSFLRRHLLLGSLATAAPASFASAQPDEPWPARPIRCIVPFPAGGGTDIAARLATRRLGEALGVPIVIENRPGAGGTIGSAAVARAAPDGYTIGIATTSTHPVANVLQRDVPYDPVTSFTAITMLGTTPYVLVAGRAVPARDLTEFLAYARARPGQVTYASVGVTTLGYLLTRQFEALAGLQMHHVPYRGSSQVYPDLLNGTVGALLDNPPASAAMVRDGSLKAFAVTQRSNLLPDVPTFASLGVSGFDAVFWYGMVAPAGLSPVIAGRIQQALSAHFLTDAGRAEMRASDIEPVMSRPAEFAAAIAADSARWRTLAQRLDIRPE